MSDKPQASAQPLTAAELENRAVAITHGVGTGVYAFIDRLLATIDALNAELHLLREGRRKLLDLLDEEDLPQTRQDLAAGLEVEPDDYAVVCLIDKMQAAFEREK